MQRAPFLGAAAALFLSACGSRQVMRALPGVAPNSQAGSASSSNPADPIPQSVLSHPIIGEARRFDGTIPPDGWALMQGQSLPVDGYRAVFRVLGTSGGGDGKTTFRLPAPKPGWIVAVAGTFPTSPQVFDTIGRAVSAVKSFGSGARTVPLGVPPRLQAIAARRADAVRQELLAARSAITPHNVYASRPSPESLARMTQVREDSRVAVLDVLGTQSRAQALALADAVLSSSASLFDATRRIAASLTPSEASAVLGIFDASERTLGVSTGSHTDVLVEAGRYVMQMVFSADQLRRLRAMQRDD